MRVLAVLLLLITVLEATLLSLRFKKIHLQAKLASGRVALKADNGLYLSRCHNCGQAAY